MNLWKLTKSVSSIYLVVLTLAIIVDIAVVSLVKFGHPQDGFAGCYAYDAMLVDFNCVGFSGAEIDELFTNLLLYMLFSPLFMIFSLKSAFIAVFLWAFPVMFVISIGKLKNQNA